MISAPLMMRYWLIVMCACWAVFCSIFWATFFKKIRLEIKNSFLKCRFFKGFGIENAFGVSYITPHGAMVEVGLFLLTDAL